MSNLEDEGRSAFVIASGRLKGDAGWTVTIYRGEHDALTASHDDHRIAPALRNQAGGARSDQT